MAQSSYVQHVLELFEPLGPVRARAMMGGHIVFCGALPVALLYDERLYLKVDEESKGSFQEAAGEPFTYELRGRVVEMSYWSPPDDALDAPEAMLPWARRALEASLRARRARPKPRRHTASKRGPGAGRRTARRRST
jgi:DNA transformation protein